MGATNATITYQTDDRAKVQKAFRADTERARFEDGHDPYSGSIGQKTGIGRWAPNTFATAEEAEEWVMDHSDKWDSDAAAAHYYVPTKTQEERARKASEKCRKAEDAAAQARREAEAKVDKAKAAEDKAQALRKPSKKRGTIVGGWVAC